MFALAGFLCPEPLRANQSDKAESSIAEAISIDTDAISKSPQLREELVAWLAKQTKYEIPEIDDKLVLNRSLERKVCLGELVFSYVQPTKRLIRADCKNSWRRLIKQPSWLTPLIDTAMAAKIEATELRTVLLTKKAVAKGERFSESDLERSELPLPDYKSPNISLMQGLPLIAVRNLAEGQPVRSSDILVGKEVIVARTTIPIRSRISEGLIEKEFRFIDVPSDAVVDETSWTFMETNRRIREGDILRERHLTKEKLVRRRDPVTLIHRSPALQIITTGIALQDGYFGQPVKVLNSESGKSVVGIVSGRGKVVIESTN